MRKDREAGKPDDLQLYRRQHARLGAPNGAETGGREIFARGRRGAEPDGRDAADAGHIR